MSYLRRHQSTLRSAAQWLGALIVIRFAVGWLLGDSADNPMPTGALIVMGALLLPLLLIAIGGLFWMSRQAKSSVPLAIKLRDDLAWPKDHPVLRPSGRRSDRQDLEQAGFRHIGSLQITMTDHEANFAVCLAPDHSTIAIVTPVHLTLVSDFGGKLVTTTDAAVNEVMPYQFGQQLPGQDLEAILSAHDVAVQIAMPYVGSPTVFSDASALHTVLSFERYSLAHLPKPPSPLRLALSLAMPSFDGNKPPVSADSKESQARVERWAKRPDRWEPTPA